MAQPNPNLSLTTPTKKKDAITEPAYLGGLAGGRKAVMKDVGGVIPEVALTWFQENALPPLPEQLKADNLAALLKDLEQRKIITSNGYWKGFTQHPAKSDQNEVDVFQPFETIAGEVAQTAERLIKVKPTVLFKCNPTMCPDSWHRENSSKPDGYGLYMKHESYEVHAKDTTRVYWHFVVAPGEKKKDDTSKTITDNNQKILWSMNHIMREDPQRRFVVGYTIEDVNMRLWFCSRSDFFVSQRFNFTRKHRDLAYFFLSLMFASRDKLGYDPTIRYASDPRHHAQNQYDIDVQVERPVGSGHFQKETYRTQRLLSNIGAEAVRGRGTRVWEVKKLVEKFNPNGTFAERVAEGAPKALKDSWIDDSRVREAIIMTDILKAATEEQREVLKAHMLTTHVYGDVRIGGQKDTTSRLRNNNPVPIDRVYQLDQTVVAPKKAASKELAPVGPGLEVDVVEDLVQQLVLYDEKCHHRLVFDEVGTPIEALTSVSKIFDVLSQALFALNIIHRCGWIHRDISSGNILVVGKDAKICDVEYAKAVYDNSQHSVRTGTAYYMALEADLQKYYFLPEDSEDSDAEEEDTASLDLKAYTAFRLGANLTSDSKQGSPSSSAEGPASTTEITATQVQKYPFKPNPIHDVESLWWLAVRLTLNRKLVFRILAEGKKVVSRMEQLPFYHRYFYNLSHRTNAIAAKGDFLEGKETINPVMRPVVDALENARSTLVSTYRAVETNVPEIDHMASQKLSAAIFRILTGLCRLYGQNDVELAPVSTPPEDETIHDQTVAPVVGMSLDPDRLELKRKQGVDADLALPIGGPSAEVDVAPGDAQRAKRRRKGHAKSVRKAAGSSKMLTVTEDDEAPARAARSVERAKAPKVRSASRSAQPVRRSGRIRTLTQ